MVGDNNKYEPTSGWIMGVMVAVVAPIHMMSLLALVRYTCQARLGNGRCPGGFHSRRISDRFWVKSSYAFRLRSSTSRDSFLSRHNTSHIRGRWVAFCTMSWHSSAAVRYVSRKLNFACSGANIPKNGPIEIRETANHHCTEPTRWGISFGLCHNFIFWHSGTKTLFLSRRGPRRERNNVFGSKHATMPNSCNYQIIDYLVLWPGHEVA